MPTDDDILAHINQGFAALNLRLDASDARFARIEQRLERIETRLDGIDRHLADHDARFDRMDRSIANLTSEVRSIGKALLLSSADHEQRLTALEARR